MSGIYGLIMIPLYIIGGIFALGSPGYLGDSVGTNTVSNLVLTVFFTHIFFICTVYAFGFIFRGFLGMEQEEAPKEIWTLSDFNIFQYLTAGQYGFWSLIALSSYKSLVGSAILAAIGFGIIKLARNIQFASSLDDQ